MRSRGAGGDCCGALHVHAGLDDAARRLARRVMASMPGDAPIVVNSAGCGAALKDYGHLLGTDEAAAFAARVVDVHEWMAPRLDRLPVDRRRGSGHRAGPVPPAPRAARPPARPRRCSPASPTWSSSTTTACAAAPAAPTRRCEPELAGAIRERKLDAIRRADAAFGRDGRGQRQPRLRDAPRVPQA